MSAPKVSEPTIIELEALAGADTQEAFLTGVLAWADALGMPHDGGDLLEKAVEARPAHYQQRARSGQFRRFHPGRATPREAETGRFRQRLTRAETRAAAVQAKHLIQDHLDPTLQTFMHLQQAGHLTGGEWENLVSGQLRLHYELAYREGKRAVGDPAIILTPQDKSIINRLLADEGGYLKGFRDHIETGGGKMSYFDRMRLYANATREAFWNGWAMGDQRNARELRWERGPTHESCSDCIRFEKMSWMPSRTFIKRILSKGYAPQSGFLECQGHNCLCRIRERLDGVEQPLIVPM